MVHVYGFIYAQEYQFYSDWFDPTQNQTKVYSSIG